MPKLIPALILLSLFSNIIYANPGDTTTLRMCNKVQMTYTGNYDFKALLPDTSKHYRKVLLTLTIGRYVCPGSPAYCGSWDYNTQLFVFPKSGLDSTEIAHVITPYTNATDSLFSHDYILDVTDFAPLLHDSVLLRYNFGGYSYGFTISLKLMFIEGIAPREAIVVKNAWDAGVGGSYPYGALSRPIDSFLKTKTFIMPAGSYEAALRTKITGHGEDTIGYYKGHANYCGEFCSRSFKVLSDTNLIDYTTIWRLDCGLNEVYPQAGTWIFQRGGWCPGASVIPVFHELGSHTPGDTLHLNLKIDQEPYPHNGSSAVYVVNTQAIFYKKPAFTLDASVEDIKSPSDENDNFRYNPICSEPVVTIRNTGTTTLTSLTIKYGIVGDSMQTYSWSGRLNFLEQADVVLPPVRDYTNLMAGSRFKVSISLPNGGTDQYGANDSALSTIKGAVDIWYRELIINFKTNNATSTLGSYNETSYTIKTAADSLVFTRDKCLNVHIYRDTIRLKPGCYKLMVTDDGCDGINWWYYTYYTTNPGAGTMSIRRRNPTTFYTQSKFFNGDFGCGYTEEFIVPYSTATGNVTPVKNISVKLANVPADKFCIIQTNDDITQATIEIYDAMGRLVRTTNYANIGPDTELNTQDLSNGMYIIHIHNINIDNTLKLVVQHR